VNFKLKYIILFILIYLINIPSFSQQENLQYFKYDIIFNGFIGGIGSGIHKKKNETFIQAFVNGFYKGMIGGIIINSSKFVINKIYLKENYWYGLEGKLIHSIGTSVVYNAALNKPIFANYNINIGFIHYSTDFKNSHFYINPVSFISFTYMLCDKNAKFNLTNSIKTGTFYFTFKDIDKPYWGFCLNNVVNIYYRDNAKQIIYQTCAHELIHSLQFEEYLNINSLLNIKPYKIINFDIPYVDFIYAIDKEPYENEAKLYSK
jgi:hypothetical protein